MHIYFLRHGDALGGFPDEARPLSDRGRHDLLALGKFLKKAGIRFDVACSSPLLRAQQSAGILLETCGQADLKTNDMLLNETPQEDFDHWLRGLKKTNHLLLVGHAPTMAVRARKLLGMEDPEALALPTSGMACVETPDGRQARLVFFITPATLAGQH